MILPAGRFLSGSPELLHNLPTSIDHATIGAARYDGPDGPRAVLRFEKSLRQAVEQAVEQPVKEMLANG